MRALPSGNSWFKFLRFSIRFQLKRMKMRVFLDDRILKEDSLKIKDEDLLTKLSTKFLQSSSTSSQGCKIIEKTFLQYKNRFHMIAHLVRGKSSPCVAISRRNGSSSSQTQFGKAWRSQKSKMRPIISQFGDSRKLTRDNYRRFDT